MKKVAIYTRISTNEERQDSDLQLEVLKEYIVKRGWQLAEVYQDEGSGRSSKRPQFTKLKKDAKQRKVDVVLVYRFDRYARSTVELINSLTEFNELGIDFVSYNEALDTTTPTGRAMFGICAIFSQFESEITGVRVTESIKKWKKDNPDKTWGRGKADKMKHQTKILKCLADGASIRKTALHCGVSVSHVQRVKKLA